VFSYFLFFVLDSSFIIDLIFSKCLLDTDKELDVPDSSQPLATTASGDIARKAIVIKPYFAIAIMQGKYMCEQRKTKMIKNPVDMKKMYPLYCCKTNVSKKSEVLYKQEQKLIAHGVRVECKSRGCLIGLVKFREITEEEFRKKFGSELLLLGCEQRLEVVRVINFQTPVPVSKRVSEPRFIYLTDTEYQQVIGQL